MRSESHAVSTVMRCPGNARSTLSNQSLACLKFSEFIILAMNAREVFGVLPLAGTELGRHGQTGDSIAPPKAF